MDRKETPDILVDVLGPAPTAPQWLALDKIRSNGGTQMRAALDDATVREYVELMGTGFSDVGPFPPIVVFHDGQDHWLADGFHRVAAARIKAERMKIAVSLPADVRAGTRRDAILYAAGANAAHGLRRSNEDKRRATEVLLRDPEWAQWSDREIARRCAVSDRMVNGLRAELTAKVSQSTQPSETTNVGPSTATADPAPAPILRRGADGRTINTANIGRKLPDLPLAQIWELQRTVQSVANKLRADDIPGDIVAANLRTCAHWRKGETWELATSELKQSGLRWRVADLAQAMNNEANCLEAAPLSKPDIWAAVLDEPEEKLPARPHYIGLVAWEAMGDTEMRENVKLLNDLGVYSGEDQIRIVEALQGGTVGTVASAVEALGIVREPMQLDVPAYMKADMARHRELPAPEPNLSVVAMAAAARSNRIGDFVRLRQVYLATLDSLERFGELTGRATLTLPVRRSVEEILEVVNAELRDLGA